MPEKLTDEEYDVLENYVSAVLKRHREGTTSATSAREDMMHPLTALLEGSPSEFLPYMRLRLSQWENA